ncbi:MAG TPA: DUF559 domain-containing protein, partial [Pseudolysinimonas sp.]|nr:DUF559 domain-containing protein [Pseudolysinimonas sp.]
DPAIVRIRQRSGLRVLSPADTWCSLGTVLGVPDLVAVADFLLEGAPLGGIRAECTREELEDAVARRRDVPGVPRLRAALPLARSGAWSRPESLLRVALHQCGLPEPALNHPVGRFFVDLAWPGVRFGIEYDGDHHRDPAQFARDIERQELIADEGWRLMRVTRADLFQRTSATVTRVWSRLTELGAVPGLPKSGRIPVLRP